MANQQQRTLTNEQTRAAFMRVWYFQTSQYYHGKTPLQGDIPGQFLEAFPVGARVEMSSHGGFPWRTEGTVIAHGYIPRPQISYEGEDLRGITVRSDEGEERTYQANGMNCLVWYTENPIRPLEPPTREESSALVDHPVFVLA